MTGRERLGTILRTDANKVPSLFNNRIKNYLLEKTYSTEAGEKIDDHCWFTAHY
jgi:hypothetical protein